MYDGGRGLLSEESQMNLSTADHKHTTEAGSSERGAALTCDGLDPYTQKAPHIALLGYYGNAVNQGDGV